MHTRLLATDEPGLAAASNVLSAGGLVAFPTETVYGLGADARDAAAVARIYAAKGRPQFNPLIVHVADLDAARALARLDGTAEDLARAFWPGALTLVLPQRTDSGLAPLVSAGLPSVALRVPAHPVAQALLRQFGGPVAAPSANLSGRISPTTATHVIEGLAGRIEAVLDGGPCGVGLESTIIEVGPDGPRLLRPGGIPVEALEQALGATLAATAIHDDTAPNAPGQLSSHYAPLSQMRLKAAEVGPGEVLLGFGHAPEAALNLSKTGDLTEAAARLFDHLRQIDGIAAGRVIAVSPVPEHGLGRAINDRLRRAAAPRPGD